MRSVIENILRELGVPFYFIQYASAGEKEDPYIVFTIYEYPIFHADGEEDITRSTVSFTLHGTDEDRLRSLSHSLDAGLKAADFTAAGRSWWGDAGYPAFLSLTLDYYYDE